MPYSFKNICGRKKAQAMQYRNSLQNFLSLFTGHSICQKRTLHAYIPRQFKNFACFDLPVLADRPILAVTRINFSLTRSAIAVLYDRSNWTHNMKDCPDTLFRS